jgi:hypothetical protein
LVSNLVEISLSASGDPDHEIEAVILWCPNPLTVDG